jgi:hypothetical protein
MQVGIVALAAAGSTIATSWVGFRSAWNIVWMILLPFAAGFACNRDAQRGAFMAMALTLVAVAVATLTGGLLGY